MEKLTWEGIDLIWVVLGFVGAALGIAYMPKMEKSQLTAALLAGIMCAALGTPLADAAYISMAPQWMNVDHGHLPKIINNAMAFFLGIGGMFIIPGVIVFWRYGARNPFVIFDWIRGKGPPPSVDNSDGFARKLVADEEKPAEEGGTK